MSLLRSVLLQDERVQQFLREVQALVVVKDDNGLQTLIEASGEEVHTSSLENLVMSKEQAIEVQEAWKVFLESSGTEDAAAEALFTAFYDSAPTLQHLFKTSRAVMNGLFFKGVQKIVMSLDDGKRAKALVEVLGRVREALFLSCIDHHWPMIPSTVCQAPYWGVY